MAQMSFRWKQLSYWVRVSSLLRGKIRAFIHISPKRLRYISRWLLMGFASVIMLAWNWKLVLATGVGVSLMLLVYLLQGWNWQRYWLNWRQFVTGSGGKLTLAVGSGGFAALGTYVAASIWTDSENRWLATGTILQGFGTLLTLGLLVWHIITHHHQQQESQLVKWLEDLIDAEPLKRLIAVQQLNNLINKGHLKATDQAQIRECFHLMLTREQEGMIREAVLNSLGEWTKIPLELPKYQDFPVPVRLSE